MDGSTLSIDVHPRVLQVVLSLHAGGTERLVVELVRRLHSEIPMAVCCLDDEGGWAHELLREGIAVHAIRRRAGFHPRLGRAVAAAAERHRANVLHCHHYSPFVYGSLARLWHRSCRIVFTEHGRLSDARPSTKRRTVNLFLSRVPDRVIAVSKDLRQHLIAEGFRPETVEVIYNGIEMPPVDVCSHPPVRERLGIAHGTLLVGTIARLDPVKDLGTLIHAVVNLRRSIAAELLVVGDGPERERLEAVATECGAARHVHFLGYRDDAREWLAGCDVYANSSISEGVSLTILEAMAAGLPIVATAVGGTTEVVDGTCALLVPSRDPGALADALFQLASDPQLRTTLGRAARSRAETWFTIDRMVQEYRDVYYGVA